MNKITRIIIVILITLVCFSGCSDKGDGEEHSNTPTVSGSSTEISEAPSASPTLTNTPTPTTAEATPTEVVPSPTPELVTKVGSLFVEEVRSAYASAVSDEDKQNLTNALEEILAKKTYSEPAKQLVRLALEKVLSDYPAFQELFAYSKPYSATEYITMYILEPLDKGVDTLRYCIEDAPEDYQWFLDNYSPLAFEGLSIDFEKTVLINGVDMAMVGEIDHVWKAGVLLHELYHVAVCLQHNVHSSNLYPVLNEGGATIHKLPMLESIYSSVIGYRMRCLGLHLTDPDDAEGFLMMMGNDTSFYALYGGTYLRLLALTDFESMALFLLPKGELQIREELMRRYGDKGGAFYDLLPFDENNFSDVVEYEALFLELFLERLNDIASQEDMASYVQLYRLYRKAYSTKYLRTEIFDDGALTKTSEQDHPALNYADADRAVAEAVLKWEIINSEHLTEEEERAIAFVVAVSPIFEESEAYEAYWNSLYTEKLLLTMEDVAVTHLDNDTLLIELGDNQYAWSVSQDYFVPVPPN